MSRQCCSTARLHRFAGATLLKTRQWQAQHFALLPGPGWPDLYYPLRHILVEEAT